MNIFLSYTTKNPLINTFFLKKIEAKLSDFGNLYIDLLHNDSDNKQDRVLQELQNADYMIVINTPEIFESTWVMMEVNLAKKKGIKIIYKNLEEIFFITKNDFT